MLKSLFIVFFPENKIHFRNCFRTSLETDLNVEQNFRQRLQAALTNEKDKVSTLQFDLHELTLMKQVKYFLIEEINSLGEFRNMKNIKKK
jgi:hypothetical protein